ncbi:MAG: hypothetical protein COA97_03110 [Flavobacteriales bacterium]|nr:MAG: hypothetical protein COA97_03110 [Flavobacteriales bacterium]
MKKYLFIIIGSSILMACGGNGSMEDGVIDEIVDNELTPERAEKAQMVFQTIPSPLETASIFQEAGAEYNTDITNPVENVSNYSTNAQKALNFGVYGADLSYANIFDQSQESMFYMNCTKKMSDGLGITSAFDAATMERIEENINNRDSLLTIINDAFWIADAHLKENGQDHLSALIIAGGWIEGLYLGTKSLNLETAPNNNLMQRIADQKYSLNNLMELLITYNNPDVIALEQKMKVLQSVFDKIEEKTTETTVSNTGGISTIEGGNTLVYEASIITEITKEIDKIRNEIIE